MMFKKFSKNELFQKLTFTLFLVMIMELGKQIIIPSLDSAMSRQILNSAAFLRNLSAFTGGQFRTPSLFSIGLGPYMTGAILFQVIQMVDTDEAKKISEHKKGIIQRLITLVIAILQTIQFIYLIRNHIQFFGVKVLGIDYSFIVSFATLVAGAMIVAWMADMNAQYGIGGAGLLILPGIITNIPRLLFYGMSGSNRIILTQNLWITLGVSVTILLILFVFFNRAELRIPIQRPSVQNDFSQSYLPIRFLAGGCMPFMFATTLFMIPRYIGSLERNAKFSEFTQKYINFDQPVGIILFCGIIIFLGYAFSFMNLQLTDLANGLKKSGNYIFGLTPGNETKKYLRYHLLILSTMSNLFIGLVVGVPLTVGLYIPAFTNFTFVYINVLITVIMLDTILEQIKTMYLRTQYKLL